MLNLNRLLQEAIDNGYTLELVVGREGYCNLRVIPHPVEKQEAA
ncbi:hypothetical protein AVT69_gp025 [Pseudomonas phage PhiPA3]|uniref:Uncharacterized protein 024A n=1 Tax=Pseudomonas phage PhiPA3 TaxID=998086 RepID=F8SJQ6_BPPA3|nr:hypothetical protein AVT69_gp025 [Pseudomonas phage PhiPA3]AEH03451.1 hypothetical protein [Pseudomonas phage PhiPA3]